MGYKNDDYFSINNLLIRYPIGKLFRIFALPAIFNMLVLALYNIVDRIFIGQGAGVNAICGLALTLPCIALISTVGTLTGVGAASRIAAAIGNYDYVKAERTMGNAVLLNLILSIIVIFIGLRFLEPILYNFGGSEKTLPYAISYLHIMIPACLVGNINFTFSNTVRIAESRRTFITIMLVGPIVNIFLDPLFIFLFKMGIAGAAWASFIAMLCSTLLIFLHFTHKNHSIQLHRLNFKPDIHILTSIIFTGMSPFIMHITSAMVNIIIIRKLSIANGDFAVGAFGIIGVLTFLISGIHQGICQGMQPIVTFNYGAGNRERVMGTLRIAILVATLVGICGFLIFELLGRYIMYAFTTDEALIGIGTYGLKLTILMLPVTGFYTVAASFFQALNRPMKAVVINVSRQFIFLIPALYILSAHLGLEGIWLATPVADGLILIPAALLLLYTLRFGSCARKRFDTTDYS